MDYIATGLAWGGLTDAWGRGDYGVSAYRYADGSTCRKCHKCWASRRCECACAQPACATSWRLSRTRHTESAVRRCESYDVGSKPDNTTKSLAFLTSRFSGTRSKPAPEVFYRCLTDASLSLIRDKDRVPFGLHVSGGVFERTPSRGGCEVARELMPRFRK